MSSYKILIISIIVTLVTVGCTPTKQIRRDPKALALQQAKTLANQGNYRNAANIYHQLAVNSKSPKRERYQMQAVLAYINAGDEIAAKRAADAINPFNLSDADQSSLFLLLGRIELNAGKPDAALDYFSRVSTQHLNPGSKLSFHLNRSAAFSVLGNLMESVRERVNAGFYLKDPAQVEQNNTAIMEALYLIPVNTLTEFQPPPPDILGGWMALVKIVKRNSVGSLEMARNLDHWRTDFPRHPAEQAFIESFLNQQFQKFGISKNIAVLLPESGPYAAVAETVREGIIAAYYDNNDEYSPKIQFFDTQSTDPYSLYRQVIAQGSDFVIGPLVKKNLLALVEGGGLPVPILALNRLNQAVNQPNFVEFGLSPEDETEQAASNAWFDGFHKALILAPSSDFGHRLASHFSEYWQGLGGEVLEVQTYNSKDNDFSSPIKQILDLDESTERFDRLKSFVWDIKFEPRRRQDVDFIFLVAQPRAARLIRPQLQFYRASKVPVYATSHIFNGHLNRPMDQDLETVMFCDIPWLLENHSSASSTDEILSELRSKTPGLYLRLIALGFDAFKIVPHLNRLRRDRSAHYSGLTGTLSIKNDNRIRRQLNCARFKNGIPVSTGLAPHLQADRTHKRSEFFSEETSIEDGH